MKITRSERMSNRLAGTEHVSAPLRLARLAGTEQVRLAGTEHVSSPLGTEEPTSCSVPRLPLTKTQLQDLRFALNW